MTDRAYDALAARFEELNDDCGYERWGAYLLAGLSRLGAGAKGLDLGCGSGAFARMLAKRGYAMSGADLSLPMLTRAAELAAQEGVRINFFQADAACLRTPERYAFIISVNDCFNYIPQGRLAAAFAHAARAVQPGGLFWFDISSEYKLREKVANNTFVDDREDVTCIVMNHLLSDRVEMDVTLFQRRRDGAFDRTDERHIQYIHREADVRAALHSAGWELLAVEGHLGEAREGSERLNFICRKKVREHSIKR